ncbi:hypothetical protein E2562_007346 [Oryza meyeriana var. granulata]|uniref:Uncharacterized protein n=1 Tax=Oryza meyeriana var. granulata TaxID=110450 RepID=A0A6G1CZJ3_9ORYZ|nr:hypothetical protein E2562_007346 [Oryza meyeriana var. granulata]
MLGALSLPVMLQCLSSPDEDYKQLVKSLGADCKHEVVKNGAKLAEQLMALVQDQGRGQGREGSCRVLVGVGDDPARHRRLPPPMIESASSV